MSKVIVPFSLLIAIVIEALALTARGGNIRSAEATLAQAVLPATDTLPPIKDRFDDFINNQNANPFDLKDPNNVEQTVEYDPATGRYLIQEKIGDEYYRPPTYMTFDEYLEYRRKQDEERYFKQLSGVNVGDGVSATDPLAKIDVKNSLIDRLFGGTAVDIRPTGGIDLIFGLEYQKVENPILPIRNQTQLNPRFDMNPQIDVTGKIGEKLNLAVQYNPQSSFNFNNQIKLNYNSDLFSEDEILKKIEAGNVSLPLRGTLIQGAQSLFGIKTELQFGHLRITSVLSQQQSQRENIQLQGGSQLQEFEVRADDYDENRHFFLAHYNRNTFEEALTNLPQIKTLFKIENLEVWITNNRNEVQNVRDIVALADLGEPENLVDTINIQRAPTPPRDIVGRALPDNNANNLYKRIAGDTSSARSIDNAVVKLQQIGLLQTKDFEKVSARRLEPSEYTYHPELGFISLNINVQPDQVVGVSYQYSYNGRTYKVGELAQNQEVTGLRDTTAMRRDTVSNLKVLYVKMLKSTTQRTDVPTWDLMMKNVYPIGAFNVNPQEFRLDVFYDDPGRGFKRFLPDVQTRNNVTGEIERSAPLVRVFNLDQLNTQGDPQPDGIFDFVPGVTINLRNGRVMFPVLEPFGSSLARKLVRPEDAAKYLYQELYDSTIFLAREFPEKNRFVLKGSYKSSVASEISLGAFNIPPGSVRVTAGGQQLIEGSDYEIDYNIGRVRILNDALLSAGVPINVSYEDNTLFNFGQKTMIGLRADYQVDENFNIGATYLHLFERPFTQKVNIGDDPINNRIYGLDVNLTRNAPFLTRLVDALPFINTKQDSKISFSAEAAAIRPGHARAINQNKGDREGLVYLDDFEGSASSFDLRNPVNQWFLSSVPQKALNPDNGQNLFPEGDLVNDIAGGVNRARLNWYLIDDSRNADIRVRNQEDFRNPYTAIIQQTEVFPNLIQTLDQLPTIQTMNLTFYPMERGPYNFDVPGGVPLPGTPGRSAGLLKVSDSLMVLEQPRTRWGGIMKALQTNDFQASNIEFLEFWMLSPFLNEDGSGTAAPRPEGRQGEFYIHLGNVSEDILRDSRKFFENGLPAPGNPDRQVDNTRWSRIPIGQQITRAFDLQAGAREVQDVGLDGLNDAEEREKFADFLSKIDTNSVAGKKIAADPSNDNFVYYRDPVYPADAGVLRRYRDFNNPEGNSRENDGTSQLVSSGTNIPDAEDINRDNTLNETESYFQYRVVLRPDPNNPREIDREAAQFITDQRDTMGRIWYRFRIPLNGPEKQAIGGIRDFRSIRFMRLLMKGFEERTTLRFATMELVRNQWRSYTQSLTQIGTGIDRCEGETTLDVDAVNIEENSGRTPFNYVLPQDIQREQSLGVFNALQNEQSLSLKIRQLCDGDARAVFKTLNFDMRVYDRLRMFVHAEDILRPAENVNFAQDGDLTVFLRLGSDIRENYYEYEIPLKLSDSTVIRSLVRNSTAYKNEVWRPENNFDIDLKKLVRIKEERNDSTFSISDEYIVPDTVRIKNSDGTESIKEAGTIKIRGNPNLGNVKIAMIGVRNLNDAKGAHSVEIWANEMRLSGLDERGGVAAVARLDMQLADLGTMTLAGNVSTIGFGALDQKVQERSRELISGYDLAASLELGKFFPDRWGLRLPFFAQWSNQTRTPEFDPYDFDVKVEDKYKNNGVAVVRDETTQDSTVFRKRDVQNTTNIRSYNFTNVRKERVGENADKPKPWDIENFSVSYAYTETTRRDPIIELDERRRQTGGLDYVYSRNVKFIEPFKNLIKSDKYLNIFKQFNFNPLPNSFGFSTVLDRRFDRSRYRFTGYEANPELLDQYATFYNKRFTWDRDYNLQWDLSRSLKLSFDALANAVIDEPDEVRMRRRQQNGEIADVDQYRRDSIWDGIRHLGRPKNYTHNVNISYQLPIRYLPYMDWIQARVNYQAEYAWSAAALNVDSLGNVIRNGQNRQFSADFNFATLYSKINYLKKIDSQQRPQPRNQPRNRQGEQQPPNEQPNNRNQRPPKEEKPEGEPGILEKVLIRPLMLLRTARFNYTERLGTTIPGFTPRASLLGMEQGFAGPGLDFIAGWQPQVQNYFGTNRNWLYRNQDWISESVYVNQQVIQEYSQNLQAQVTVEPFRDFRVDVDATKVYQKTHSQYFKVFEEGQDFNHRLPQDFGSLNISFFSANTLFQDSDEQIRGLFSKFESFRPTISKRIGTGQHDSLALADQGYTRGYGRTQQDVLIPAFLAAYTDKDPRTIPLNVFDQIPRPNWRLTYNGLSRLPFFQKIFQNFSLTHSYKSTLTLNRFNTGLDYLRESDADNPTPDDPAQRDTINELNGNFYPRLEIPEIVIQEGFAPLLAVNATLQNGMQFQFDYKKSRTLAMSFINNQLSETQIEEMSFTFGYLLRNVNIGFLTGDKRSKNRRGRPEQQTPQTQQRPQQGGRSGGGGGNLQNRDMDIQFTFSLRDDVTYAHILDQGVREPTRGAYVLRFNPTAEYKLNRRLSLRAFFEYTRNIPKISAGFPRTDSSGGVVVRFTLN